MDVNNIEIKDGDQTQPSVGETPSIVETPNPKLDGSGKKKRRRGKSKRKIMKPFIKAPWQDRRKYEMSNRNNRFRKIVLAKTHAPFNNNQFLMEIHKPEPENSFSRTPARTRDSSFSVDSEDNYFFSLPEDEEEYLTKEFSSVYEDAQCERLSNMSKNELIQEYLLLEAKYDNLLKRTERSKPRFIDENKDAKTERDLSVANRDSTMTDKDTSATSSSVTSVIGETSIETLMRHVTAQETHIRELQHSNDQLRIENDALRRRINDSSSEDSESDSDSTSSGSSSSSSCKSMGPAAEPEVDMNNDLPVETQNHNGLNGGVEDNEVSHPLVNGFLNPSD